MRNFKIISSIVVIILSLFLWQFSHAAEDPNQKILELRAQIAELERQADAYKKSINQKQKEGITLTRQIDILETRINQLLTQISITSKQIESDKAEIGDLSGQIDEAERKINLHNAEIKSLVTIINENDQTPFLAQFFKNPRLSDFADAAQQDADLTIKLAELLVDVKDLKAQLEVQKVSLEAKKSDLENLNKTQLSQKTVLNGNKGEKEQILTKTKGQEAKYQAMLSDIERKKEEFFNQLKDLEAQAIKSGAYILHVTATSLPARGSKTLHWPEDDYRLTQGYGMTSYARKGAYGGAPHNGADIASGCGSSIHPVLSGKILVSGTNDGWGNWVAVIHEGNFVSLYGHMRAPSGLTNGTPVTTSDVIGYEGSTGNATGCHLHLSLYKDFFTYINPKNGQVYFNYFEGTLNPLDYL